MRKAVFSFPEAEFCMSTFHQNNSDASWDME